MSSQLAAPADSVVNYRTGATILHVRGCSAHNGSVCTARSDAAGSIQPFAPFKQTRLSLLTRPGADVYHVHHLSACMQADQHVLQCQESSTFGRGDASIASENAYLCGALPFVSVVTGNSTTPVGATSTAFGAQSATIEYTAAWLVCHCCTHDGVCSQTQHMMQMQQVSLQEVLLHHG